ncbi:hypothetical protein PVK06_031159 [Gossypium arboreum]|uniref:Uncharacterized protein n=1 Tax=Gossypium arboreum TaxID=29729 RepID=A0ABR0NR76_GOSAR|nr:hypothetical protein PVK06_031159 [Gossypium arboreum]
MVACQTRLCVLHGTAIFMSKTTLSDIAMQSVGHQFSPTAVSAGFFPDLTRSPCRIASIQVQHPKLPSPGNEGGMVCEL